MITYIQNTAKSLGAQYCPHCQELDIAFGLAGNTGNGGVCVFCNKTVSKYPEKITLQFSLDIIRELLKSYDDYSSLKEKQTTIKFIDDLLFPLTKQNSMPSSKDFLFFKTILLTPPDGSIIGSPTKLCGAIHWKNGLPNLALDKNNITTAGLYSLSVCLLSILYIKKIKIS
jgi:hypothetical protein